MILKLRLEAELNPESGTDLAQMVADALIEASGYIRTDTGEQFNGYVAVNGGAVSYMVSLEEGDVL
jgi:hypothetical protein